MRLRAALAVFALVATACSRGNPGETSNPPTSPQASANETPLTTNADAGSRLSLVKDAGPPPSLHGAETPFPQDVPLAKEPPSHLLRASFRFADAPAVPRIPELNAQATETLRRKLDPTAEILLTPTRLRFVARGGFVVPNGTELRSRIDLYGHLALVPGGYRVVVPGALRALFNEGRLDAGPLAQATIKSVAPGAVAKRLGYAIRRVDVTTRVGRVTLELAKIPELSEGGALLARLLLDLASASPETDVCEPDEVPLRAEYHWQPHGVLFFEATDLKKQEGIALLVPPPNLTRAAQPLRIEVATPLVPMSDFSALRTHESDERPGENGPPRGAAEIANTSDAAQTVWLDGVPVAWLPAGSSLTIPNLYRGKYPLLARSFLGGSEQPSVMITVPGRYEIGGKSAEK